MTKFLKIAALLAARMLLLLLSFSSHPEWQNLQIGDQVMQHVEMLSQP